jgi:hypothetical protein
LAARVQGTNSPYFSVLDNDNNVEALVAADGGGVSVFGSISNHAVQFRTNNTEKMRIDASGNTLIGRTTQIGTEKLSVQGATLGGTAGNTSYSMTFYTPDVSNTTRLNFFDYRLANGTSHATSQNRIQRRVDATEMGYLGFDSDYTRLGWGTTDAVYINSSGNVGIGTASASSFNSAGLPLVVGSGSGNTGMTIYSGTANYGSLHFADGTAGADSYRGAINYFHSENAMRFYTNGTQRAIIDSLGNVGIGTNSPTNFGGTNVNVTAANSTVYASQLWTSGAYVMQALVQESGAVMAVGARSNHHFAIATNDTERARFSSTGGFSVGTTANPGAGAIFATGNITAYYSDARLKDFKGKIGDALYKVSQLNGYYYTENEKAEEFGYNNKELQVGVSAQEVQAVLPEVVTAAPFDLDADGISKSGEDYMTVRYEKLVPLLIEAIKELKAEVEALKAAK